MRILREPDANTGTGSSAVAETTNPESSTGEATTVVTSATEEGAKEDESPESGGKTLEDVVREAAEGKGQDPALTGDEETSDDEAEEKKVEEKKEETEDDESEEVDFHEHPRWIKRQKELEELRPLAEQSKAVQTFLDDAGLTPDHYREALEMAADLKNNPAKALERLRPVMEALGLHSGERLPEDLQEKVTNGVLDPETAKETAILRAQVKLAEFKRTQESTQSAAKATTLALNEWESSKRTSDPDYAKKAQLIEDRFLKLTKTGDGERSPKDFVALAEQAYTEVTTSLSGFVQPRPSVAKPAISKGSSKVITKPKTMLEAVQMAAARHDK